MGKKKKAEMEREKDRFIAGAVQRKVAEKLAREIFEQMETFAAYGFNKSHSAAYALISYQTAYLKAHFPEEFMAGLMTLEMGETDKTYKNIAECREHGIAILPPDVNESREDFTVGQPGADGKRPIRFGLGAVRGVGSKAIEGIIAAREQGAFTSLADFCKRVQTPAGEQARHRKPDQVRRLRLPRRAAAAPAGRRRPDLPVGRAGQPRRRAEPDRACSRRAASR